MSQGPSRLRARAHPRAVAAVWAWHAVVALLAAWPAASLVRAVFGSDPRGDASLYEPGGAALLDFLWHGASGATAVLDGAVLLGLAATAAGWVPLAALMTAIERPRGRAPLAHAVLGALRVLPAFVKASAMVLALQGATLGAGAFLALLVQGWTRSRLGEAPAQMLEVAVALPFAGAALALGVTHDLARSVVVVRGARALEGLLEGARIYRAASAPLSWSWTWRTVASLAPVALAAVLAGHAGAKLPAIVLVALAHQGAVFGRVAFRASWLACAMRAASAPPPQTAASER